MKNHSAQWEQIRSAWAHGRMPQALLLVGPLHCGLRDFTRQLSQLLLCQEKDSNKRPCLKCANCNSVTREEHPDMEWIRPEKNGSVIKIDQIRPLQSSLYLTPQRAAYRITVIDEADRMNTASANALLKILEEPPSHTVFILLASQAATLLPTILSRCRLMRFSSFDDSLSNTILLLGKQYPKESSRAQIIAEAPLILEGLIAMMEEQESPCAVAASWAHFEFSTVLWFLYLVFAEVLQMQLALKTVSGVGSESLLRLSALLKPVSIFAGLDLINRQLRQWTYHLHPNASYALEQVLFSVMDGL